MPANPTAHRGTKRAVYAAFVVLLLPAMAQSAATGAGETLYQKHCASCHDVNADARIPSRRQLSFANPLAIVQAMRSGVMRPQAQMLSEKQQIDIAEALTGKQVADLTLPQSAFCRGGQPQQAPLTRNPELRWSGWGGNYRSLGHIEQARSGLNRHNLANLELKWVFANPGTSQARSVPTIIDEVIFLGSQDGTLYALDLHSGCIYWSLITTSAIRGGLAVRLSKGLSPTLFFANRSGETYAVDARHGSILWRVQAGSHPLHGVTGGVIYHDERVYVPLTSIEVGVARTPGYHCCTSAGAVAALDADDGSLIWRTLVTGRIAELQGTASDGSQMYAPSGAPIWATPTLDVQRHRLYIGSGENYSRPATLTSDALLALDLTTGEIIWHYQATADDAWHTGCSRQPDKAPCDDPGPDLDFGMSPLILDLADGTTLLIAGQKSAVVHAIDTDGKPVWQRRVGKGGALGGIHWGIASDGQRVYVANSDRPAIIRNVNPQTPMAPGLYALDVRSGDLLWATPTPGKRCEGTNVDRSRLRGQRCLAANSAAPLVAGDLVFAGDLHGHLRAYDAQDGRVLWSVATDRTYEAVNGLAVRGGSIDGPAPIALGGLLMVNSGYGSFGQQPGNAFVVYGLAEKQPSKRAR